MLRLDTTPVHAFGHRGHPMEVYRLPLELTGVQEACAHLMTTSEPWMTLGRTYQESLAILQDPVNESYAVMNEAQLAGFFILTLKGAFTGYVKTVALHPDWRGQGLGKQVFRFIEALIFPQYPNVFLCVSSFNPGAKRFYESIGYKQVGEVPDYVVKGESEFIMRKTQGSITDFMRQGSGGESGAT